MSSPGVPGVDSVMPPLGTVTSLSLPSVAATTSFGSRAAKRTLDVLIAAVALILLAPVLVFLMGLVRADSGGPALFSQVRLGRDRRPFRIYKLRTMHALAARPAAIEGEVRHPLSHRPDPELITRFGAFLRRSALDEIPQLLNVLRGEMSLVGPRPFVPEECDGLPPWSEARFKVKPGMTGIWQVRGQHSLTVETLCMLDLEYASSWSVPGDLYILALTPARLLRGSV